MAVESPQKFGFFIQIARTCSAQPAPWVTPKTSKTKKSLNEETFLIFYDCYA